MSDTYSPNPLSDYATIFGGKGMMTYEQLKARRAIAAALAARGSPYPKTLGEGFAAAGDNIAAAIENRRLEDAEKRQAAYDASVMSGGGVASAAVPKQSPTAAAVEGIGGGIASGLQAAATPSPGGAQPGVLPQQQPQQRAPIQPQAPQQAPAAAPVRLAIPQAPPAVAAGMTRAFDERGVAPEERDYYTRLAYHESKFNPDAVSSTGAEGPFQFTRGTARDYNLANRRDPYASTLAAIDLTGSNRQALRARLGRDPTPGELALAHNQGATGAGNLLSGMPAPANNLAVNGVRAGATPQQASEYLQTKLGFDPRRAVAASLTAAPTTMTPPAAAAGVDGRAAGPQPPVQLASTGPYGAGGGAGGASSGVVGQAPSQPTPNQRIAQAPVALSPAARQEGVGPLRPMPVAPRAIDYEEGAEEARYRRGALDPYASESARQVLTLRQQQLKEKREKAFTEAKANYDADLKEWQGEAARRQAFDLNYPKQQAELATSRQALESAKLTTHGIIGNKEYDTQVRGLAGHSQRLQRIQDLVKEGVFTGLDAPVKMVLAQVRAAGGGAVDPRLTRTEQLKAELATVAGMQRLDVAGPGAPSNKDMELLQDAAAGKITLTAETIKRVSEIAQRLQLSNAMHHQSKLAQFAKENPEMAEVVYGRYGLPMESIVSNSHPSVQRLLSNPDPDHVRQFNEKFSTPGLAEKFIARHAQQ